MKMKTMVFQKAWILALVLLLLTALPGCGAPEVPAEDAPSGGPVSSGRPEGSALRKSDDSTHGISF